MVNLVYLGTLYVHPVTRPIFCNILGINWQYYLKPCLRGLLHTTKLEHQNYVLLAIHHDVSNPYKEK